MTSRMVLVAGVAVAVAAAAVVAVVAMSGSLDTGVEPQQDMAGGIDEAPAAPAPAPAADEAPAAPAPAAEERLDVLASFYPMYESARAVGGDRADVSVLVPGGVEPHDWEPSFSDIERMQDADVIVTNGIGFESWLEDLDTTDSEALVVDASEGIEGIIKFDRDDHDDDHGDEDHAKEDDHDDDHAKEDDHDDDHGDDDHARDEDDHDDDHARDEDDHDDDHARDEDDHDDDHGDEDHAKEDDHDDDHAMEDGHDDHGHAALTHDPHVWLNPVMVKQQVMNIADGLSEKDPQNADYYRANAAAYAAELDALDRDIREGLDGCATDFITFHAAFSYFAAEYGLVPHPVVDSIDPHGAPTAPRIKELVDKAESLGMDVVFFEEGWDERTARTIAAELGDAEVMSLATLELAPSGGPSYTEKMRSNLDSLRAALC